jgi:hypothetical protein
MIGLGHILSKHYWKLCSILSLEVVSHVFTLNQVIDTK